MKDRESELRQRGVKRDKLIEAKLELNEPVIRALEVLPMHQSMTDGAFEITAVPGGWLYTRLDNGTGKLLTTTFVANGL